MDVDSERWLCGRCEGDLGPARSDYKRGCLVADRDPREVHGWGTPSGTGLGFTPDPEWCRVIEFYCPGCSALLDVEYLPPGHPLTHDLQVDVDSLKRRLEQSGDLR